MKPNTESLQLGLRLRQRGLDAVEDHNLTWVELMRRQAVRIAMRQGSVTTDDLQEYARQQELQPEHPNAWGAVLQPPQWICIGRVKSKRPSAHGREIRVWAFADHVNSQVRAA